MLAKILKGNQIFIPIFIMLLWIGLFYWINDFNFYYLSSLLSVILMFVSVVVTVWTINTFPYFKDNYFFTFLLAVGSLLLSCCFQDVRFYAGFFFVTMVIMQIFFTNQHEFYLLNAFDLGFFMGFAVLFYPPFWIFAIFLLLHYLFLGKTQLINFIMSFVGLVTFSLLFFEVLAVFDMWYLWDDVKDYFYFYFFTPDWSYLFLTPLLIPYAWGIIDYFVNINRQTANKKMVFFDATLLFVIAFIFIILYGGNLIKTLTLALFPIFLFSSNFITYHKKIWIKEAMIWLVILGCILFRFKAYLEVPHIFEQLTF